MQEVTVRRLGAGDVGVAREAFGRMAEVFAEEGERPGEEYVRGLLERGDFVAFAAVAGEEAVGGVTGWVLPLTRRAGRELFVYDIAVAEEWQGQGVGRALLGAMREAAEAMGAEVSFVLAEEEDEGAVAFYRALGGEETAVRMFDFGRE